MRRLLLVIAMNAAAASGQVMDATHVGDSVVLQGNWRFHAGDDPSWAQPGFDDSGWRLVPTNKDWDELGLQSVRRYFWFRAKLTLPAQTGPLSLLVNEPGPYDLFIDGKKAATYGKFPPAPTLFGTFPQIHPLPSGSREVSLALRYWMSPIVFRIGKIADDLVVGTKTSIERRRQLYIESTLVQQIPDWSTLVLTTILCAGLLVLFYLQRERTEYLFLALALLAALLSGAGQDFEQLVPTPLVFNDYWNDVTQALMAISTIEFVFSFLRQPVPRWLRIYEFSMAFLWVAVMAGWSGWVPATLLNAFFLVYFVPYWFSLPIVLLVRFARGNKEAGLLALPLSLLMLDAVLGTLGWVLYQLHLRKNFQPLMHGFHLGEVAITPGTLFFFLFLLSIGALILLRFQNTRVERERANAELEAARSMQEVMVPKSIAARGFLVETAYIPAAEVGGDFFQLFPGGDGSLLVVIGDVSGKGMKAAMLVSLILGLLRRTVALTRSPAQILTDVNEFLIGHTDGKFATCCCALMLADGGIVAANAGHLSPYCDGREMELPPGLPLGLSPDATYEEVRFETQPGKRWVFLSDGVVEARNKSGELYGFDRTRSISIQAVHEIAHTAQRFGQEDDITVLGIAPEAASV